jgi:hypothetical protein
MMRRSKPVLALALFALGAAAVARAGSEAPSAAERSACQALGDGTLKSPRVRVERERRVPECDDDRVATRAFLNVDRVLSALAPELRPELVTVRIGGVRTGIEARPLARALVVSESWSGADDGVWLHEVAHLVAHGPRPRRDAARRLARAVDEGFADYFAAAVTRSPLVGSGHAAARDVSTPPELSDAEWAWLGLPGFDAHRFGWALAAGLWRAAPHPGPLLEDVALALSGPALEGAERPADVLSTLIRSCPERSQRTLSSILRRWAPAELFVRPTPGITL